MVILKKKTNRFFHFFYELALLLTLCILLMVVSHLAASRHYNIDRILGPSSAAFTAKDTSFIAPGDSFAVYRFNPDWTSEIGWVRVTAIEGHEVFVSFDPSKFRWPMGRQGKVIGINGPIVKIAMGSDLGFKTGDILCIYKDRALVGRVQLQDINPEYSSARILNMPPGMLPKELTASEFIFVTQVAFLKNPFINFAEVWLFIFIFLAHCYYFIVCQRPLLLTFGESLRHQYNRLPKDFSHFMVNVLLGIPFIWFIVNFIPRCLVYLTNTLIQLYDSNFHFSTPLWDIYPWYNENITSLYLLTATAYTAVLIWKNSSPILLLWQWVRYRCKEKIIGGGWARDLVIWSLHLIIFYAFGGTLWKFLTANANAMMGLIWANGSFSWNNLSNLSHLPSPNHLTFTDSLMVLRYFFWSVAIVGCLFGYGYSILGYAYGKRIRNLDFTLMGWITNAVCYGPLLGVVIAQMTPSLIGRDPVLTQGLLRDFVLITELILNILYTMSIWNLGTMFGVMTDKGVRTSGFYSVVRHPSYTLESLMFLMMFLNGLSSSSQWLAIGVFIFNYYVRSEREDQFMSESNPDYKIYQEKTVYKFIPGIY